MVGHVCGDIPLLRNCLFFVALLCLAPKRLDGSDRRNVAADFFDSSQLRPMVVILGVAGLFLVPF